MNTSDQFPGFFAKPTFRSSAQHEVLKGSARRALETFDTGYRFSCSFFPSVEAQAKSADRPVTAVVDNSSRSHESVSPSELERLLERNLLPPLHDEAPRASRQQDDSFRPELIELSALLVIVGVVLTKLFAG